MIQRLFFNFLEYDEQYKKKCHPHSGGTFIVFYNLCLVEAKKDLQASVDAREAHEGQR